MLFHISLNECGCNLPTGLKRQVAETRKLNKTYELTQAYTDFNHSA